MYRSRKALILAALATCCGMYYLRFRTDHRVFQPMAPLVAASKCPVGMATDGQDLFLTIQSRDASPGSVVIVSEDGGRVTTLFDNKLVYPLGLSIHGDSIYIIDCQAGRITDTQILRGPKDGSAPLTPIYTGSSEGEPIVDGSGIVFDSGALYTTDMVQGRVHRVNADGTGVTELGNIFPLRAKNDRFWGSHRTTITANSGLLYIADAGDTRVHVPPHVRSIPEAGGPFRTLWTGAPLVAPAGITAYDGMLYIADPGAHTVWNMPIAGGKPVEFATGHPINSDCGIAVLHDWLYVTDSSGYGKAGGIYRIRLDQQSGWIRILGPVAILLGVSVALFGLALKRSSNIRRATVRILRKMLP